MASEPSPASEEELRAQLAAQQELINNLLSQQQNSNPQPRESAPPAEDSAPDTITDEELAAKLQREFDGSGYGDGYAGKSTVETHSEAYDDDAALARRLEAGDYHGGTYDVGASQGVDDEEVARQYQLELDRGNTSQAYEKHAANDQDAHYASMLQHMEIERGDEERAAGGGGDDYGGMRLEDPVWGTLDIPEGNKPKPMQILCFAICPCCAGAVCERRRHGPAWLQWCCPIACAPQKAAVMARIGRTMSAWLALIQLFFVGISIALSNGFAPTWINPMLGPYPTVLNTLGAKNAALIVYRHEWWRLLTPMLLHAGFIHLAVNVLIQLRVGVMLELEWGLKRFSVIYFVSGLTSSLLSCLALPDTIGVGSSGALMGILGAWFVEICCKWSSSTPEELPQQAGNLVLVFLNIVVTLSFSTVPYVDWAAHTGGLLGGMLLSAVIFSEYIKTPTTRLGVRVVASAALVAYLVISFVVVATILEPDEDLLHVCKHFRNALNDQAIPC